MICGDFHIHIRRPQGTPLQNALIVAYLAKAAGMNAVGLGDHRWLCTAEIAEEVRRVSGLTVVRMVELDCTNGAGGKTDLLALNVRESPIWGLRLKVSVREAAEAIHAQGGRAVMPHPFDRAAAEKHLDCLDGIEYFNGDACKRRRDHAQFAWVEELVVGTGVIPFANSDTHVWQTPMSCFGAATSLPDNWFGQLV